MRQQLAGLPRYIATAETAKHRLFQFLDAAVLPDNALIAIASNDAFHLGVLSSRVHEAWALAVGGRLGVGNDPRYNKTRCFETFPFPDEDTGLTPELRQRIASLAEQIDAHRKRQQAASPGLTLTGTYNVLEALREGRPLSAKEKTIHTQGLVSVLKELHDELDASVLQAYGLTP
ncbi:MAG: SAM-dependent methyltransferase, partial [Polaromonas sp.]|nr:SAM-dependent methyltransferase [Polaromonas sp.]